MSGSSFRVACVPLVVLIVHIGSQAIAQGTYSVTTEMIGGNTERKFRLDGFHFGSLIDVGQTGTYDFRPRPGSDINGFGSSLYLQPFLAGATLRGTVLDNVTTAASGIRVQASGIVSRGTNQSFGTWSSDLTFSYDPAEERVLGSGTYSIATAGSLTSMTGDLNIYRLASNFLDDVPLVTGGTGDTGDMHYVDAIGDAFSHEWFPPENPAFFPTDETENLTVDMIGQYNIVDTAAQGHLPIADVFKPGVRVTLASTVMGTPLTFGAFYDTNVAQDFAADNIGVTPLIRQPEVQTSFAFNVTIQSDEVETSESHVWTGGGADDRMTNRDNWNPAGIPAANWIVDLNNGLTASPTEVTVDRDCVIRQLTIRGTAGSMQLKSNSGKTLTVTDTLHVRPGGSVHSSGGTMTCVAGRDGDP